MRRRSFLKQALAGATLTTVGASLRGSSSFVGLAPNKILALAGTNSSWPTSYTRMFQLPAAMHSEEGLKELAETMRAKPDPKREAVSEVTAGYTYLGQFIDHDLTLDLTPFEAAKPLPEQTRNFRTPFLDLDQLYGGGPNLSPHLYQKRGKDSPEEEQRFLLGETKRGKMHRYKSDNDLPRNRQGTALVGDPRQDENVILAQLHVAFLTFHNAVLEKPDELKKSPYYEQAGSPFAAAQRLVRWHYQWIVRNDYLQKILHPDVFAKLPDLERSKRNNPTPNFEIPFEFSVAAFRFGHSMVRDEYDYSDLQKDAKLPELLERTGAGPDVALSQDWVISWDHFFELSSNSAHLNRAQRIDTKIAGGLFGVPPTATNLFSATVQKAMSQSPSDANARPEKEARLPARTLLRGQRVGLPSGQTVAQALCIKPLEPEQIATGMKGDLVQKYRFHEDTPLWYYILKESELPETNGLRLGLVGSHIVADVIIGALVADPESYLSLPPDGDTWNPTLAGGKFEMKDILRFIAAQSHQTS